VRFFCTISSQKRKKESEGESEREREREREREKEGGGRGRRGGRARVESSQGNYGDHHICIIEFTSMLHPRLIHDGIEQGHHGNSENRLHVDER